MGRADSPRRILVTAFEPFGLPGRPARATNASEEVARAWEDRSRVRHPVVVFPVDPRCEVVLARALDSDPAGVIALGEAGLDGPWDTNVESCARDLPVRPSRDPSAIAAERVPTLTSRFAPTLPLLPGMEREDRIGSFWCNRAYWRVLQWCNLFGRPAVFLHLRVDGDRLRQTEHLAHVVDRMERALADGAWSGSAAVSGVGGEASAGASRRLA